MKKVTNRAVAVLLLAFFVVCGLGVYVMRYIDHGGDWALYFSAYNSGASGELVDRHGRMLASFNATESRFAEEAYTRVANYHVTGDYWGRTGTGVLTNFWSQLQGFSLITGTTQRSELSLTLTVDAGLNNVAYRALAGRKGAVMVMNYQTGEILCMASAPSLDPLDASEPQEGAYINRCISASFIPGSVFKLITAAAAIEKIPNIFERTFYCEGEYEIAGVPITCSGTHYTQSFRDAMANSCNVAFAQIAVMVGQTNMINYVKNYGFLSRHSIEGIPTAAGSYPTDFVGDPELAWSGIGQSTDLVCPFSLLRYVAAIANDGMLIEPHLAQTTSPGHVRLVKPATAQKLLELMRYNVTGHYDQGNFPGLSLCAKTGTAELGDGTTHAWFTGFLTDDDHPYAFVVLVERGGGGLSVAGSVANEVLQYAVKNN